RVRGDLQAAEARAEHGGRQRGAEDEPAPEVDEVLADLRWPDDVSPEASQRLAEGSHEYGPFRQARETALVELRITAGGMRLVPQQPEAMALLEFAQGFEGREVAVHAEQ